MQALVQGWLVFRLSGSATWLGGISFLTQGTAFVLSPWVGTLADRLDRRRLLLWVNLLGALQAAALGVLTATGWVRLETIGALAVVLGVVTAFEITVRHALAADLVGPLEIPSAISLNAIVMQAARVIGPGMAGLALPTLGEAGCFGVNAASYVVVAVALATMRSRPREPGARDRAGTVGWPEVVRYLRATRDGRAITRLLALSTLVSALALPYTTLLPFVAERRLAGDEHLLAGLTIAAGLGSILGVLTVGGRLRTPRGSFALLLLGAALGVAGLGLSDTHPAAFASVATIGAFVTGLFPRMNITIQSSVAPALRGRVLSLYTMTFFGAMPLGGLVLGRCTDLWGLPPTLAVAGLALAVGALAVAGPPSFMRKRA